MTKIQEPVTGLEEALTDEDFSAELADEVEKMNQGVTTTQTPPRFTKAPPAAEHAMAPAAGRSSMHTIHSRFVPRELAAKADMYAERNKIYGDNYKRHGPIMALIMATQQLNPADPKDMARFGIFTQIVAKVTRYGENFNRGGHDDSLDDISVYAMMLKELDSEG